jgi:hypothetical protein
MTYAQWSSNQKIKETGNLLLKIEVPLLMMKSQLRIFDVELVAEKKEI